MKFPTPNLNGLIISFLPTQYEKKGANHFRAVLKTLKTIN